MQFCGKMLRRHVAIDNLLDSALTKGGHLIQAEEVFRSDEWGKPDVLDIAELLSAKQTEEEQEKAEKEKAEKEKAEKEEAEKEEAEAKEKAEKAAEEQAAAEVAEMQPESQPAEPDEPMPEAPAEEAHVEPQKLDRLQFFSELFVRGSAKLCMCSSILFHKFWNLAFWEKLES